MAFQAKIRKKPTQYFVRRKVGNGFVECVERTCEWRRVQKREEETGGGLTHRKSVGLHWRIKMRTACLKALSRRSRDKDEECASTTGSALTYIQKPSENRKDSATMRTHRSSWRHVCLESFFCYKLDVIDLNSGPKVQVRMGLPNQHEDKTIILISEGAVVQNHLDW